MVANQARAAIRGICDNEGVAKTRELEVQLSRAETQLRLFQKISRLTAKASGLREALDLIAGQASEYLHADSCLLYLLTADQQLMLCAARGANPAAVGRVRLRLNEGLTGWVASERRLVAISCEAYQDPRFKFFRDLPEDRYEAFLSAPLIARNRVVGVINLQHQQPHSHNGDELEMLTTLGEQIGALVALAALDGGRLANIDLAELALGTAVVSTRN
jgi:signal transduction protein with GAF and PtsI domain